MKISKRVRPHKDMTPEELRLWRAQRPGDYAWKFNQRKLGWSQARAAEWYGVSERQWVRYESGENAIPLSLVKRMIAHETSFDDMINRIWETTPEKMEEYGGIFPRLAHEGRGAPCFGD